MTMRLFSACCLTTALVSLSAQVPHPGDLSVFPNLVVFDGSLRNQEIRVQNTGKTRALYRIQFQAFQMNEEGRLEAVPDLAHSAVPLLRFSPRQVELAPGEIQTVRMQIRRPEYLEPGEYRTHLVFKAVPFQEAVDAPASPEPPSEALNVQLTAIPSIAVPITVLHGRLDAAFSMEDVHLVDGAAPHLTAVLLQKGRIGLRGQLVLHFRASGQKQYREYASLDVVHYGDLARQRLRMPLPPAAAPLRSLLEGTYTLVLRDGRGRDLWATHLTIPSSTGDRR